MSLVTLLITGLTTKNIKVQLKGLIQKSQTSIQRKTKSVSSTLTYDFQVTQFLNLSVQKAGKTAFQLSNHLEPSNIFGSVHGQLLQQPGTRLYEYAYKAKFPASQESTSLIYPRARMYPIFEQELWGQYKGKNTIQRICLVFLWMSGCMAILTIWPNFKNDLHNQWFVFEIQNTRKKSIFWQLDKRVENAWKKRFYKTANIQLNLLTLLSKEIQMSSKILALSLKEILLETNVSLKNKGQSKSFIKASKQILESYRFNKDLKNQNHFSGLEAKNSFSNVYLSRFVTKDLFLFIKQIIFFIRRSVPKIILISKDIIHLITNYIINIENIISLDNNILFQRLQQKFSFLLQVFYQIFNKFIQSSKKPVQILRLSRKTQVQELQPRMNINATFLESFNFSDFITEVVWKILFWKALIVRNWIKLKEQFEQLFQQISHTVYIYFTKLFFIYEYLKKEITFKKRTTNLSFFSFLFYANQRIAISKNMKTLHFTHDLTNESSQLLNCTVQKNQQTFKKPISQRFYRLLFAIRYLTQAIKNTQRAAYQYLKIILFISFHQLLQNLNIITWSISKKQKKQIALHIESYIKIIKKPNKKFILK
uniref:hypothetical protein n=1 Tax=Klebsormidium dissectum TaxID=329816 RepID=UPI00286C3BB7|nr:hypothetical protein RMD55_pgp003 [Klebsormidium dissectum]WKT06473.1 hypothetical protein [Klebsormidium dissectum]